MNVMRVSPLLKVSTDGPASVYNNQNVHLRQGELDGACGPYCVVSALIALGLMDRYDVIENMHSWKGSTREGRFRDALYAFGPLVNEGTYGDDLVWLTDFFKHKGLHAQHVEDGKKQVFNSVAEAIDLGKIPIIGVHWPVGGGHWMLVAGYQGFEEDGELQLTHLLCLDPGQDAPKTSLWNAVIEVFYRDGASVNRGRKSSNFWGMDGQKSKCQINETVILETSGK